ncbi:MAG: sulfide/dihydroorotate dehydrogenase-like FAD/NAD-binding protein [Firmicutes bacterium]|nr:sulfide/dihydroorotate dehydrogenase-like FAD/NAD-binding protein [Bacillota bacterium]
MYQILEKEVLAPQIFSFTIDAPEIAAKAEPGHFLIVRVSEKSERIPLTIADFNRKQGALKIIVQEVGFSSKEICNLNVGDGFLDVVGPLGNHISTEGYSRVICVGGGLGAAPLYPKAKSLSDNGTTVISILGAKSSEMLIMEDEFKNISAQLLISTDDGSKGKQGFVTDILQELLDKNKRLSENEKGKIDLVIAIGPMIMMKSVAELTKDYGIETLVSLNSLMVDGTGMCGGCRVTIGGESKFACVDGPVFDGHQVDFEEQMRRQNFYKDYEAEALNHAGGEHKCHLAQQK